MIVLCIKIFFTRILDVSLGTFRTIVLVKGKNVLAGIIGFFEVFIWFVIVQEALNTETNIWIALFYSLGFASGTIIGAYITNYFITSPISVQIVTKNNSMGILLQSKGFGVTSFKVKGKKGIKNMLIIDTTDKRYKELIKIIKTIDDTAFIVIDETKQIYNGFIEKHR